MGPMFSKESRGKGNSDISATDTQDSQEQAVDKEFQKYFAEDLISINDKIVEEQQISFSYTCKSSQTIPLHTNNHCTI